MTNRTTTPPHVSAAMDRLQGAYDEMVPVAKPTPARPDDLVERLRDQQFANAASLEAAYRIAALEAQIAARPSPQVVVKPDRDTFDAMCAMRNAINEYIPMPSLESDLLQGPDNSVFCAAVAEAVIAEITRLRALAVTVDLKKARLERDLSTANFQVDRLLVLANSMDDDFQATKARLEKLLGHVASLNDPITVHSNMLRGVIARPTIQQIIHLYGVDALCKALAPIIVREAEKPDDEMEYDHRSGDDE